MNCIFFVSLAVLCKAAAIAAMTENGFHLQTRIPCHQCKDNKDFCGISANTEEMCHPPFLYYSFVQTQCPLTCGLCKPCRSCGSEEICEDKSDFCTSYKDKGQCETPDLQTFMKETCSRSCGFCVECQPEEPSCSNDCRDDNKICPYASNILQYCNPAYGFEGWMKKNCEMSCKVCTPCPIKEKEAKDPSLAIPVPKPYVIKVK